MGRVRLRFISDVMLLEFGLLPGSLALFSGSLMPGGACFWRLSVSCWFLADSCTLRVRYCLFFWRRGLCWRSVSLSRRSYSNKAEQNEETDKSSATKASLITNIVTQRPNRATSFSRPARRFHEKTDFHFVLLCDIFRETRGRQDVDYFPVTRFSRSRSLYHHSAGQ